MPEARETIKGTEPKPSDTPILAWKIHPAAERKGMAIMIVFLIAFLGVVASLWMRNIYWGIFAIVLLFLSLEAFFLPSKYELSERGVRIHKAFSNADRPWNHYRRVSVDRTGITLSPFRGRNWLEAYRATRLGFQFGGRQRDPAPADIRALILDHIDRESVLIEGLDENGNKITG
jgi:hypothetical protein